MSVNQSARIAQILIDGVDFSPCLVSAQGSDNHLDQSGLITFSGQIVLGRAIEFSETIDDRKSSRFCRGKTVALFYRNSSNVLQKHPRGALRILKSSYSTETQKLTLDVGDLIGLLNFKEPTDPDKADNKSCEGKTAGQVIISLLNEAGITSVSGALPGTRYNYPLNISGSYLDAVGRILYANNCFGWIDRNEVFQIRRADIVGGGAGVGIEVGVSEIWYKRLEGAESPVEKVKAVGNEITVIPSSESSSVTEIYGSNAAIIGASSGFMGQQLIDLVIERTEREETIPSDYERKVTTATQKPYGLAIPSIWWDTTPRTKLIPTEETETIWKYENNSEGKLLTKTEKIHETRATYLAELRGEFPDATFEDFYDLTLTKQIIESYFYNKEIVEKIVTQTQEINIAVLNATEEEWLNGIPEEYMVVSELKTETWTETSPGTWEYYSVILRPVVRVDRELVVFNPQTNESNKLELITYLTERRLSNSGQENPPATERAPTQCNTQEKQIEEFQIFVDTCASNLKPRERTFTVDMLPGKMGTESGQARQCLRDIAIREGRLLKGREKGQEIATNLRDTLFEYHPLMPVYCKEPDGTIQSYLADGCSWVLTANRALWSCDGIWVGTLVGTPEIEDGVAPEADIIKPWAETISFSLAAGHGINIRSYPYGLDKPPINAPVGAGHGINVFRAISLASGTGHGIDIQIQPAFDTKIVIDLGSGHSVLIVREIKVILASGHGIDIQIQPAFDPRIFVSLGTGHGIDIQIQQPQISWRTIDTLAKWKAIDEFIEWKNIIF